MLLYHSPVPEELPKAPRPADGRCHYDLVQIMSQVSILSREYREGPVLRPNPGTSTLNNLHGGEGHGLGLADALHGALGAEEVEPEERWLHAPDKVSTH